MCFNRIHNKGVLFQTYFYLKFCPTYKQELLTLHSRVHSRILVRFVLFDLQFFVQCFTCRCLSSCPFFLWPLCCLSFDLLILIIYFGVFKLLFNIYSIYYHWYLVNSVISIICLLIQNPYFRFSCANQVQDVVFQTVLVQEFIKKSTHYMIKLLLFIF